MNATYTLTIGRKSFQVASLAEASATYERARDASGKGYQSFPTGKITPGDFSVSYNGKVWPAGPWAPGRTPLYVPDYDAKATV